MALPVLEKTWQYNVNQSTTTSGVLLTDCRAAMFKIKQSLIGFTNGWTVVNSSNASLTGGDCWASVSDLSWASSGVHSWIVLQQTGVNGSGTTQICIDLFTANAYQFYIAFSPSAGFAGGSTSARPTATDEYSTATIAWFPTSAATSVIHATQSSTGDCTRVFVFSGGTCYGSLIMDTMYSDSPLSYKGVFGYNTSILYANVYTNTPYFRGIFGSTKYAAYVGVEQYQPNTVPAANAGAISDFSSAYPFCPISLHSTTIGARGRCGRLSDIFLGSTSIATGSTYPSGGSTFAQFGTFIIPWNGTVPVIT